MAERRYVGIPTVGRTANVLDRIKRVVLASDQTHVIPVIKVEKKAHGQFYVFLAVEGVESQQLPEAIKRVLNLAGLSMAQAFWPLAPDEIKSMVSTAEIETYGFSALQYRSLWDQDFGDPYDVSDEPASAPPEGDKQLQDAYDKLLYWMSAQAEGTWETFVKACIALNLALAPIEARWIFRRLMLLGHAECATDGMRWTITPAALVLRSSRDGLWFLCGQRTPKLISHLSLHSTLVHVPQAGYLGPSRVEVQPLSDTEFDPNSDHTLYSAGDVSLELAALLPDIDGWKATLTFIDKINTATCSMERWDGRSYEACHDFYQRGDTYVGPSGLYRLTRGNYQMVLYFDQDLQRWLKGDWYGLRFLVYKTAGQECEIVYETDTRQLMIPVAERWPLLYERALVLATGELPFPAVNREWLCYDDVSIELAVMLANKLGTSIKEVSNPPATAPPIGGGN
jgi:hypothetical protein